MQLFLVRHADASFEASSDHQRPLSPLGRTQASQSADYIEQQISSDTIQLICSDALRTQTTAKIIQQQLSIQTLESKNTYYHAGIGHWCDGIAKYQHFETLILVGHNPTMGLLARHLNARHVLQFSPACVAQYELEIKSDGLNLPASLIDFFKPHAAK